MLTLGFIFDPCFIKHNLWDKLSVSYKKELLPKLILLLPNKLSSSNLDVCPKTLSPGAKVKNKK